MSQRVRTATFTPTIALSGDRPTGGDVTNKPQRVASDKVTFELVTASEAVQVAAEMGAPPMS